MNELKAYRIGWILAVLATVAAHDQSFLEYPLLLIAVGIPALYHIDASGPKTNEEG